MSLEASDAELVHLIEQAGEGAAQAEVALYQRFARRVELYGLRHLRSQEAAQDLVQQVMISVLSALRAGRLQNHASLVSFVLGTCRNVTWDMRRKDRRQQALSRETDTVEAAPPPSLVEGDVLRLFGCLASLPEREATVVRMSFWEDRDAEEIAQRIGVSTGNVRVIRHRAVVKLAACVNAGELP